MTGESDCIFSTFGLEEVGVDTGLQVDSVLLSKVLEGAGGGSAVEPVSSLPTSDSDDSKSRVGW